MQWISTHFAEVLMVVGILALIIEVAILGFSTFILLFFGLATFLTGLAVLIGIIPDTYTAALLTDALLTAILSLTLWKPLKRMQNIQDDKQVTSDFDGLRFYLEADLSPGTTVKHRYSGIDWSVKSNSDINAGTEVEVTKAEVGILWVKAV